MAVKFRSDGTGHSQRVAIDNNFVYDGEFGFGIGGNTPDPGRFVDYTVSENVLYHIGKSNPTNRNLARGIDIQDHVNSVFRRNYFIRMPEYGNSYGIHLNGGTQSNVRVEDNFMYNIQANSLLISNNSSGTAWNSVAILRNLIQNPFGALRLTQVNGNTNGVTLSNNRYYRTSGTMAQVNYNNLSYQQWLAQTGETGSQFGAVTLRDPNRTLETYMQSLSRPATTDEFLTSIRAQRKGNWSTRLTAAAINAYFKEGYSPLNP